MKRLLLPVIILLVTSLMVLASGYLIIREYNHQTSTALERRETIATLGATLIHEKFDRMIDIGISLASRPLVYQNIEKGDWEAASKNLREIPQSFPYIEMVGFFNTEGVLKAVIPQTPELIGKSFAYRDYYKGVSKEWKPYVSEVFKRAVEPKYNVVSIAVPIQSPDKKILGVLLLTIKLDVILEWTKDLDAGPGGLVFVVDKNGQLVEHPKLRAEDELINYSFTQDIQRIRQNERGTEIHDADFAMDEKHVGSYAWVKDYGFGIEIMQPTRIAFAERKNQLIEFILFWTLIILATVFFLYRILKSREVIRAQRDHKVTLLQSIGDGVVAIDRNWNITLWNKAASIITGWSKEEALGKPLRTILKLLREHDRSENITFIEDAMVRGVDTSMFDHTLLIRKDGSEIPVGDSAAPIFCANNETPDGVIIVFRDMSLVHEKNRLRSDFTYASHQFRTPITEALWNLETGIDEEDSDKRKEHLRIVYQALLSVRKLSEHLVFVSEIDQEDISVNLSPVKFIDVLTEVQQKIAKEATLRDVTLSISPVSHIMAINTDKKLLYRALFEIIENAVIYSHPNSKVDVMTTMKDKELLVEIVDTGVGITEEEQPIIFTKFFRGSNRGKENAGGGLGLYLAKAYITLIGGKVWFESKEGEGTTFYISLPVA